VLIAPGKKTASLRPPAAVYRSTMDIAVGL
jgi:hypothetical protein